MNAEKAKGAESVSAHKAMQSVTLPSENNVQHSAETSTSPENALSERICLNQGE